MNNLKRDVYFGASPSDVTALRSREAEFPKKSGSGVPSYRELFRDISADAFLYERESVAALF